jgi:peptidoglycan/xylan/chitin deacetylase (PgdA/CDA1 family)
LLTKEPGLVGKMSNMGHEIGSHTHTHRNLASLQPPEIEHEFRASLEALSKVLGGCEVRGLAYPFGAFNDAVVSIAKSYFRYGRTMERVNRWNEDIEPYRVGSMGVRHLLKCPFKALVRKTKLIVLTFHREDLALIRLVIGALKALDAKILPLGEALERLGI